MSGELKTLQDIMTCHRHSRPAAAEPGFWRPVVLQQHPQAASICTLPTSLSSAPLYFIDINPEENIIQLSTQCSFILQAGQFCYVVLLPFLLAHYLIKTDLLI